MKKVIIYTDGACSGNPGPGGWGAILLYGEHEKEISGYVPETTNNRMEMQAVIEALKVLKQPCMVELYTDSDYVVKGIKQWLPAWKAKQWRNAAGKEVKNKDLWQELEHYTTLHNINWHWVRGHDGNQLNERADRLAVAARDMCNGG